MLIRMDRQKFRTALGAILRDAREAQHITRPELAELVGAGLSRATIQRYESGARGIPVDVYTAWCEALDLDSLVVSARALDSL
jgi:transcriptional regulator with XRE-family HTH domain